MIFSFVSILATEDHTVVSVGPYTLYISAYFNSHKCSNKSSGKASPPINKICIFCKYSSAKLYLSIKRKRDGVICKISILWNLINSKSILGEFCSSCDANIIVFPNASATHVSNTKISKLIVVKHNILFPRLKSILLLIPKIKLSKDFLLISTPLGFPVEPDVYITYAVSSPFNLV